MFLSFIYFLILISCRDQYDFQNGTVVKLFDGLNEVSGLVYSSDGKLFAHNDEIGKIYEVDPKTGKEVKRFFLGKWTAEADFEGIAISRNYFYLITSNGLLYQFKEGKNRQAVNYKTYRTGLSASNNIEGLCYDKKTNTLLIACKEDPGKKYKGYRAVYSYVLNEYKLKKEPRFLISLKKLKDDFGIKKFYPSGIEKNPVSNTFFIISAREEPCLVELSESGEILDAKKLKKNDHPQPEGITFDSENNLIISDEAAGKRAKLTIYSFKE
ncbi:MAG: SdiA-regulated domain-containing protein [Ignavibacteria bacterium]|jgi:uncharacterized protein YjiK